MASQLLGVPHSPKHSRGAVGTALTRDLCCWEPLLVSEAAAAAGRSARAMSGVSSVLEVGAGAPTLSPE